jgi:hypothetical protein
VANAEEGEDRDANGDANMCGTWWSSVNDPAVKRCSSEINKTSENVSHSNKATRGSPGTTVHF